MNIQTNTKYIDSTFAGLPPINREYGSLIQVLKKVLTEGFNPQIPKSIDNSKAPLRTIVFENNHNFQKQSVVQITNISLLKKDYRVVEKTALSITVHSDSVLNIEDISKISTAPLGYEIVYTNTPGTTVCFKSKSSSPAVLKVIDEIPPGYPSNWSRFARVVIGSAVDEGGNFINNLKTPSSTTYPYPEISGNGGTPGDATSTFYGYAKWNFFSSSDSYGRENVNIPAGHDKTWMLIGDDKTFYIFINDMPSQSFTPYGFGALDRGESSLLIANIRFYAPSTTYSQRYNRSFNSWGISGGSCYVHTAEGESKYSRTNHFYYSTHPWNSSITKCYNPASGKMFTTKMGVFNTEFEGNNRGIRIFNGNDYPKYIYSDTQKILIASTPDITNETMPLLFSLEDWD